MTFVSVVRGQRYVSLSPGHDDTIQKRTSVHVTSPMSMRACIRLSDPI